MGVFCSWLMVDGEGALREGFPGAGDGEPLWGSLLMVHCSSLRGLLTINN